MNEIKKKANVLPMVLGLVLIIPIIVVMIEYWYLSNFFPNPFGLTKEICWIIVIGCGTLAGIAFNWNAKNKIKSAIVGAISGLISGGLSIWVAGGYLYLRGFPKSLYRFEFIIIVVVLIVIGVGVANVLAKLLGSKKEV